MNQTSNLQCIPAIDIRDGNCVRLLRGNFSDETLYGDPLIQAQRFVEEGATSLHVVDLDAARTGEPINRALILKLIATVGVPVQVGGGVRAMEGAKALLDGGAARVILGTVGVEDPPFAVRLANEYPHHVVVGLDYRTTSDGDEIRREIAVRGWKEGSGVDFGDAIGIFEREPFAGLVVTDISRDGTLEGPDLEGYRYVLSQTDLPVIASGGIGAARDLENLAGIEVSDRRLFGVVIGKALLSGALSVKEAIAACAR